MISWDCFDTLIARKFIHPFSIFHEVANRINDPSFVQKRIEAGSDTHTYEEIYKKLPYDPQIELDIELEHAYPIKSNIESVNNKDIIITDMYLPDSFIQQLLQKCGLDKDIHLIRTFNGKQTGQVWKNIDSRYIDFHIGDNQHSDYDMPQKYKIKTIIKNQIPIQYLFHRDSFLNISSATFTVIALPKHLYL
jgi:predicted HAD superfamily hydrolase